MKSKISRILGVVLTVVLLASLMIGAAVTPAGAAAGKWAALTTPAAGGAGGFVHQTTFGAVAGSIIRQSIDGTLWAYRDDGVATTPNLYMSTDGGYSWARKGGATLNNLALVDIIPDPTDASIIWVATTTTVYKSINTATAFTALVVNALQAGTSTINDVDVAYIGNAPYVFASTAGAGGLFGGLYVLGAAYGAAWADLGANEVNNTWVAEETVVDVLAIKASQDFSTSQMIIAVVTDGTNTWSITKYGGGNWGATCGAALLTAVPGGALVSTGADIGIPADFDPVTTSGLMEYFVSVDTGAMGEVFRIVLTNAFDRNVGGAASDVRINSIDVKGTVGAAWVMAGAAAAARTYYSADNSTTWLGSRAANHPAGSTFLIDVALDEGFATNLTAWAATQGNEGGIYNTINGREWHGLGLLNTDINAINDFAIGVGSETVFISVKNSGGEGTDDMIWRHDGNWELVLVDQIAGFNPLMVAVTDTFDTDTTAFAGDPVARRIARTTNSGDRWVNQSTLVPAAWASWAIQSPTELVVGNNATNNLIYQTINNGTTWNNRAAGAAGASIVSMDKSPEYATDSTIIGGTSTGLVVKSVNSGTNWAQIPAGAAVLGAATNTFVTFNGADANQVFAANVTGTTVHRLNLDAGGWTGNIIVGTSPAPGAVASAGVTAATVGITSSPEGVLYVADVTAGQGVTRCVNPTAALAPVGAAPFFEDLNPAGSGLAAAAITIVGPQVTPGSTKVWIGVNLPSVRLFWYDDVAVEGPTGLNAVNVLQTSANLTWGAVDTATRYIIWYNLTELAWSGATQVDVTTSGLAIAPGVLVPGSEYHFRVAIHEQMPALSRWSAVGEFTTGMGASQWSPFAIPGNVTPSPGASGVDPISPLFQWNPSTGATGYEFQLSTNAGFAGANVKIVKAPAYEWPGDLEYGTVYYWRVRAINASGGTSAWGTGTFTTAEVPVEPTPPIVIQPAPPAPPAPAQVPYPYIPELALWLIVGIGGVLIIALIILIMKTRRVA